MLKTNEKKERLEARVPAALKVDLLRAASLERKSLTDFLIENLSKAARQTIDSYAHWQLSQADAEAFADALLNPPAPNEKLQRAFEKFRQRQSS
jgi:uncharacterized protein (DUF1778 family)